jgi:hypothetical protein
VTLEELRAKGREAVKTGSNYGNNKRERILRILPIAPPRRIRMPSQIICRDASKGLDDDL